jgi:hypothetical protein
MTIHPRAGGYHEARTRIIFNSVQCARRAYHLRPMDYEMLKVFLQAVSSLAIAAGLIFAAVQFYYARKAQHVANFTRLVELQFQLRKMRVDDPSLASIYKHDVQGLHSDRDIREYFMNLMQLSVFEIVWFSHRLGQLPDDYYESWVKRMREIEGEESFKRMINNPSMKILHDDFQKYIVEMANGGAGRSKGQTSLSPSAGRS